MNKLEQIEQLRIDRQALWDNIFNDRMSEVEPYQPEIEELERINKLISELEE